MSTLDSLRAILSRDLIFFMHRGSAIDSGMLDGRRSDATILVNRR